MTTALAPIGGLAGLISPTRSYASSTSAQCIYDLEEQIRAHFLESYTMRHAVDQALTELESVAEEASSDGWDGYGARKLSPEAYAFARIFITALPTMARAPEVGADNDGEVALEWIFDSRKALSVSIGPAGRCTYAWIRGESSGRGTDWIVDEIPASIVHALGQLNS